MSDWYVSTAGVIGNTGAIGSPWNIGSAITGHSGAIQPGDTVWLRGGTYNNTETTLTFTVSGVVGSGADNPDGKIQFRAYRSTLSDVSTMERVVLQETISAIAPTSGGTTVGAGNTNGSTTLQILKGAGVNQPITFGNQITIASGPAAGIYVVQATGTITQGTTTGVSVLPGLRGTPAGGETITLTMLATNGSSGHDLLQMNCSFVWLRDLELAGILPLRTQEVGGPTGWSTFNQVTDGNKLVHCIVHDLSGGMFIERTSGRMEAYGNLLYNQGYADVQGDGGGHHIYIHHNNASAKRLTVEANCMFNDEGIAMQMYDALGVSGAEQNVDFLNNICFNSGALNTAPNQGGVDSKMFIIGGPQEISSISCRGNYGYFSAGKGDTFFMVGQSGQLIGAAIELLNNYCYGGGAGFGSIYIPATLDVPGGGTFKFQGNTIRLAAPDATHNGRLVRIAQNGGTGYTWGGASPNTYIRNAGVGGNACGDETGSGVPLAFQDAVGGCRTLAQFLADTGFTGDTLTKPDPSSTLVVTIPATRYDSGRGWVLYYNYANLTNIPFLPSDFGINVGDTYVVHDVRNVWAGMGGQGGTPIIGPSVYAGGTVNLPNTQLSEPAMSGAQVGLGVEVAAPTTAPFFNVFLVRRTAQAAGPSASTPSSMRMDDSANAGETSSIVTSATSTTLTDALASWFPNRYAGTTVTIVSGKGVGQTRTILSHTNNTLTLSQAWIVGNLPTAGSVYEISGPSSEVLCHFQGFVLKVPSQHLANYASFLAYVSGRLPPWVTPPAAGDKGTWAAYAAALTPPIIVT